MTDIVPDAPGQSARSMMSALMASGSSRKEAFGIARATFPAMEVLRASLADLNAWRTDILAMTDRNAVLAAGDAAKGLAREVGAIIVGSCHPQRPGRTLIDPGLRDAIRDAGLAAKSPHRDGELAIAVKIGIALGIPPGRLAGLDMVTSPDGHHLACGSPIRAEADDWIFPVDLDAAIVPHPDADLVVFFGDYDAAWRAPRGRMGPLPERLVVLGDLKLDMTGTDRIPDGIVLGGALSILRCPIESLPSTLVVGVDITSGACDRFRMFREGVRIAGLEPWRVDVVTVVGIGGAWDGTIPASLDSGQVRFVTNRHPKGVPADIIRAEVAKGIRQDRKGNG